MANIPSSSVSSIVCSTSTEFSYTDPGEPYTLPTVTTPNYGFLQHLVACFCPRTKGHPRMSNGRAAFANKPDEQKGQLIKPLLKTETGPIAVHVDAELTPNSTAQQSPADYTKTPSGIEMTPVHAINLDSSTNAQLPRSLPSTPQKQQGRQAHFGTNISRCIKQGHLNCVRSYAARFGAEPGFAEPLFCGEEEDDDDLEDFSPPPDGAENEAKVNVRRQYLKAHSFNSEGFTGPYRMIEFKQICSPIIWALDCLQWDALGILSTIPEPFHLPGEPSVRSSAASASAAVRPVRQFLSNRPQVVMRKQLHNKCLRAPSSPQQESGSSSRGLAALLDPRQTEVRARPGGLLSANSWSSLAHVNGGPGGLGVGLSPLADVMLSLCSATKRPQSAHSSANRSPQRELTQTNSILNLRKPMDLQVVLTSTQMAPSRGQTLGRAAAFRLPWTSGCHTYQSVLDYFIATGYELVGTDSSLSSGHTSTPDDPRNNGFHAHFGRLGRVLRVTGVPADRLDAVVVFNAILTSAGHRLSQWCQFGAAGDQTVARSHVNRCLNREPWWETVLEKNANPLIEWRILATLIDHGLTEFEWLEFQSPQFNLIGQILCVLTWPVYGWTARDARAHFDNLEDNGPGSSSASPPELNRKTAPRLGQALRRQACLLLANLWSLGAFRPYELRVKLAGDRLARDELTTEGGEIKRCMLRGGADYMAESSDIDPLMLTRKWNCLQRLWQAFLLGNTHDLDEIVQTLTGGASKGEYAVAGATRSNSGCWEVGASLTSQALAVPHDPRPINATSMTQLQIRPNSNYYHLHYPAAELESECRPPTLKLLSRKVIRRVCINAQLHHPGLGFRGILDSLNVPSHLRDFLGYVEDLSQLESLKMPVGLRTLIRYGINE